MNSVIYHFKEYSIHNPKMIAHDVVILTSKDQIPGIDKGRLRADGFSWIKQESRVIYDAGDIPLEELAKILGLWPDDPIQTRQYIEEELSLNVDYSKIVEDPQRRVDAKIAARNRGIGFFLRDKPSFCYEDGILRRVTAYYFPSLDSFLANVSNSLGALS